jgi:hypothetical protein
LAQAILSVNHTARLDLWRMNPRGFGERQVVGGDARSRNRAGQVGTDALHEGLLRVGEAERLELDAHPMVGIRGRESKIDVRATVGRGLVHPEQGVRVEERQQQSARDDLGERRPDVGVATQLGNQFALRHPPFHKCVQRADEDACRDDGVHVQAPTELCGEVVNPESFEPRAGCTDRRLRETRQPLCPLVDQEPRAGHDLLSRSLPAPLLLAPPVRASGLEGRRVQID